MKCPLFTKRDPRPQRSLALVSVLILVVLITAVILGFLITSGLEQTSSRSYKASSSARLMADTAINLVQGQINEATSQGMSYAWASQPGAIRTYNNTGELHQIYKLYSAQNLTTTDATNMDISTTAAGSNDMPPSTWAGSTAQWVDLNSAVKDAQGNTHYPILDPTQAGAVDGFSINTNSGIASATSVPMPVRWLYVLQNGQIIPPDVTSSGTVVTFAKASVQPSAANPIVGRIAYWTDDETSKVNVNTAGGDGLATGTAPNTDPTPIANATFWDTPRFSASDETNMAGVQPTANEFQRYPGHPATVALNNILNGLGWNLGAAPSASFYSLTPRYALGGSKGGTVPIASATSVTLPPSPGNRLYSSVAEMLFTSGRSKSVINADDNATRQKMESARFFLTAHSQAPEVTLSGQPRVSIWPVWSTAAAGKSRTPIDNVLAFTATVPGTTPSTYYFTRADSTSATVDIGLKESNGQYRNQTLLNYLDYFTSASQAIPGYGGSFDGKYFQTGKRQILTEIFDYIRTINMADTSQMTASATANPWAYVKPWQGDGTGDFGSCGEYQVAPSMINSTTAPQLGWTVSGQAAGYQGFGAYPRLSEVAIQFVAMSSGAIPPGTASIPMQTNYTMPAYSGWFDPGDPGTNPNDPTSTVNKVTKDTTTTDAANGYMVAPGNKAADKGSTVAVQAVILLNFIQPAQMQIDDGTGGHSAVHPFLWVEIKGLDGFTIASSIKGTDYPLKFPADDIIRMVSDQSGGKMPSSLDNINFGNMVLFSGAAVGRKLGPGVHVSPGANSNFVNPFFSHIIPLSVSSIGPTTGTGTMVFKGTGSVTVNALPGYITVSLYDGAGTSSINSDPSLTPSRLVQTYTIQFPASTTLPIPTVPTTPPPIAITGSATATTYSMGLGLAQSTPSTSERWDPPTLAHLPNNGLILPGDVVQSMVLSKQWSDLRMLAIPNVPAAAFTTHPSWGNLTQPWAYGLTANETIFLSPQNPPNTSNPGPPFAYVPGVLNPNATYYVPSASSTTVQTLPFVPATLTPAYITSNFGAQGQLMDWDNGLGSFPDGPWINKVDEGQVQTAKLPYFTLNNPIGTVGPGFFSPNREVPSPGVLGSLSTGVDPTGANPIPWRTLLFRPCPGHFGATSPPDHLMLDLFWMPTAEPYAISEPFSSAGKINLNYQIEPFSYINRSTALRAVLNTQKIAAVTSSSAKPTLTSGFPGYYKAQGGGAGIMSKNARYPLNIPVTLAQFDDKFNGSNNSGVNSSTTPDIFHSASQICEMYLVPDGNPNFSTGAATTYTTASAFATDWYDGKTFGLVGDNTRERPYTDIYGLVTTKSNTFTVYYTVQSLKNAEPPSKQSMWDESQGTVLGEYRGATTLERYIDPNQNLPDFAASPGSATLDGDSTSGTFSYYKWRVVENHQFAP